jgi:ubiquinone biosynthesis protein
MPTPLRRVFDNVRTGQAVWRDAGRMRQIVAVLLRHGFGAVVQTLELQDSWVASALRQWRASGEVQALPLERRMVHVLQELGPTFIKLGQMLSTRPDLFPPPLIQELQTLQDNVPPLPFEEVAAMIRTELGGEIDALFDAFDHSPLATASIAQVHAARLPGSGADVVVKVQRPNLEPQITADLEIMAAVARALEANFPETRMFSPAGMVAEFQKAILREIDFGHELENLETFRANFAGNPNVHFPEPHPTLSSSRVLTMERIYGTKITAIDRARIDADAVLRTALDAVLQMIYADGFFHGDLHPGNVLVRDDGTVCFIDVGLVGRLSPRQRDLLTDLLVGVVRNDWESVARRFWTMAEHTKESTADYGVFERDVVEQARRWFAGKTIAEVEFGRVLKDLIGLSLRHRLRLPPDYTMTFKAVVTMEGVGKQLQPDLDLLAAAQPFMLRLVAERYQPRKLLETGYTAVRELAEALGTLPDTTRSILEDLRAGRTLINVESPQLEALQRSHARTQHRTMVGALAGACAVCGTLALDYGSYRILGLPVLSFWFYAIALALGGRYLTLGRKP